MIGNQYTNDFLAFLPECPTATISVQRVDATTQADISVGSFLVALIPSSNITGSFRQQSRYDSASEVEGLVYIYGDPATHTVIKVSDWFFLNGYRYEFTDVLDYPSAPLWEARARIKK
jgi:hypothetical protein